MNDLFLDNSGHSNYNNKAVKKIFTSGCGTDGSALGSGPRGREFKSRHSDHIAEPL